MIVVEEVCTITAKGQTTVPKAVRQALGVGYGDRIAFRVEGGSVTVRALPEEADGDPALAPFLALLAADLAARPDAAVQPIPTDLLARTATLAREVGEVDPEHRSTARWRCTRCRTRTGGNSTPTRPSSSNGIAWWWPWSAPNGQTRPGGGARPTLGCWQGCMAC